MQKLTIPTGAVEIEINGKQALRVNPGDPEVYMRCAELCRDLPELSKTFRAHTDRLSDKTGEKNSLEAALEAARELDAALKQRLSQIFNADFNELFEGASVLAIAENGHTVLENLLTAVTPVLENGLAARQEKLRGQASAAVAAAAKRRSARGTATSGTATRGAGTRAKAP